MHLELEAIVQQRLRAQLHWADRGGVRQAVRTGDAALLGLGLDIVSLAVDPIRASDDLEIPNRVGVIEQHFDRYTSHVDARPSRLTPKTEESRARAGIGIGLDRCDFK